MRKEITFYVFLGEKRDPSEIYANSNLRNVTHITQKPSYVYTFFTSTLKEITALLCELDKHVGTTQNKFWTIFYITFLLVPPL
jgi:hypothetical protein